MTVRVIYLNGVFEYFYDIESVTRTNEGFLLHTIDGEEIMIDFRLKLEVTL